MNRYDILMGKAPKVPNNLDECLQQLEEIISQEDKQEMTNNSEDSAVTLLHHSLGQYLRNFWDLWGDNSLTEYFNNLGIFHADDMSGIIMTSFHRKLSGKALDLQSQVDFYKEYWKKIKKEKSHVFVIN